MLLKFKTSTLAVLMLFSGAVLFSASEGKPAAPAAPNDAKAAEYTRKLDERVAKIVAALELKDSALSKRMHNTIVAQYRTLNTWHETHDARLKELKKTGQGAEAEEAAAARTEIESIQATLKTVHENFLAELAKELSPELIERVKDGMTAGKVKFTYNGYLHEYPGLTDEQKAKVLEFLKEAREEAMDGGSMDEKSDIFNRYKGRINNWLSKQGVDSSRAKKAKAEKKEPAQK